MRIGLDFDNTLAQYDHVFAAEAKLKKLIPTTWKGTKKLLRDTLRTEKDGDLLWQKLQGRVYGPMMSQAELFPGVATVVTKLLIQCSPDYAIFGEKDYQQLQVIKQLVSDLDIPVNIVPQDTVREKDGLALSTRNVYLNAEQRILAPLLYSELQILFLQ